MKLLRQTVLALGLVPAISGCYAPQKEHQSLPREAVEAGIEDIIAGKLSEAQVLYAQYDYAGACQVLEQIPESCNAYAYHALKGKSLMRLANLVNPKGPLDEPRFIEDYRRRKLAFYSRAESCLSSAIKLSEKNPDVFYERAFARWEQHKLTLSGDKLNESEADFLRVIELSPETTEAYSAIVTINMRKANYEIKPDKKQQFLSNALHHAENALARHNLAPQKGNKLPDERVKELEEIVKALKYKVPEFR
jgi:tetratricopeptide (TPR) repeat protein